MGARLQAVTPPPGLLCASPALRHCSGLAEENYQPPTLPQLRAHFLVRAVPMVGFGLVDNTVMIQAGNLIDLTLGVTFGLSTLAAAACGQICSDVAGVSFGGIIEAAANKLGLPSPSFTDAQRELPQVKRLGILGGVCGVFTGCSLGLVNLMFVDTEQAREMKLAALDDLDHTGYSVSISNTQREGVTAITVEGPAQKGLVASVTAKISAMDLGIEGVESHFANAGEYKQRDFLVTRNMEQIPDEELEEVAQKVLRACRNSMRMQKHNMALEVAQRENEELKSQVKRLQSKIENLLIKVEKKN